MTTLPRLRLKKSEERRLRSGHLWIFSNEVDTEATPLTAFDPGQLVVVENARREPLGVAYVNPESLISARLLTRDPQTRIDAAYFAERFERAGRWRARFYATPYFRLVFGESDGLPGLVVDRYGDVFVLQINTAGMERLQSSIVDALARLYRPRAVVFRNDSGLRRLEGLASEIRLAAGQLQDRVIIEENQARFWVDPLAGQKTGWFFDHRDNRALLARLCRDRTVLDLFAYSGAWSIPAALAGAARVESVDVSDTALALAAENAELNAITERMVFTKADAFAFLKAAREERRRYDVIILDPPAFIKRKKDLAAGVEAYRRLNQAALQVLNYGGILVSASCSYHLQREQLHELLRAGARHVDRHLLFFARGGQSADHPIHPAIPETDYLKAFFCQVDRSF